MQTRRKAEDAEFTSTDNEDHFGKGKRKKIIRQRSSSSEFEDEGMKFLW